MFGSAVVPQSVQKLIGVAGFQTHLVPKAGSPVPRRPCFSLTQSPDVKTPPTPHSVQIKNLPTSPKDPRTDSHWLELSHMSIPKPMPVARRVAYSDWWDLVMRFPFEPIAAGREVACSHWPEPSHVLSLALRGGVSREETGKT